MSNTPIVRQAAIYREAARIIERRLHDRIVGPWSCLAIAKAADPSYIGIGASNYMDCAEVRRYEDVFEIRDNNMFYERDHRIVALCMMAAMVEAGDA